MQYIGTIAKAIVAAVTAFGAAFAVAYTDQAVSSGEWVTIALATIVALAAVYAVPNKPVTAA